MLLCYFKITCLKTIKIYLWHFTLFGRAKITDREWDVLFLITDRAIKGAVFSFDGKTARERHPNRVARLIEHEHREAGYEMVKAPISRPQSQPIPLTIIFRQPRQHGTKFFV